MPDSTMRAACRDRYGSPDVLVVRDVPRPTPGPTDVLVAVRATTVAPGDYFLLLGRPYVVRLVYGLTRPNNPIVGIDFAGEVVAVGAEVTRFAPGDRVYGEVDGGAAAELCATPETRLARMPANLGYAEAASLPVAGITALQGLRAAGAAPGRRIAIVGASGAVGTLAVQIARARGAEVTAVCGAASAETARALGADRVVDYATTDYTAEPARYDAVFDLAGDKPLAAIGRALAPDGVLVGATGSGGDWFGPLPRIAGGFLTLGKRRFLPLTAKATVEDLDELRALVEAGTVRPVIDRRFALPEIADAYRAYGAGHARGRTVVTV